MSSIAFVAYLLAFVFVNGDGDTSADPTLGISDLNVSTTLPPSIHDAERSLLKAQKEPLEAVKIACVGDSITEGALSSSVEHTYPSQLQKLLDTKYGSGAYRVTNLGASGSTLLKKGNSPYWQRPQFQTLTQNKWDIVIIMLGTNDAKDAGSHGPDNWHHDCGDLDHTSMENCSFANDYNALIATVKQLGTTPDGPVIYLNVPIPLMQQGIYGMNQTVINGVFPRLVPLIQKANVGVRGPIDLYSGMGGVSNWKAVFPDKCTENTSFAPCKFFCDSQSCDQCHPNDNGYHQLATLVLAGLHLDSVTYPLYVLLLPRREWRPMCVAS